MLLVGLGIWASRVSNIIEIADSRVIEPSVYPGPQRLLMNKDLIGPGDISP